MPQLSEKEQLEMEILRGYRESKTRWMTQEEQNRLDFLWKKHCDGTGGPHELVPKSYYYKLKPVF